MEREYYFRTVSAQTKGVTNCDSVLKVKNGINASESPGFRDGAEKRFKSFGVVWGRLVNTQKMEAISFSETSVNVFQELQHVVPKDLNV
jgi:hypothetical protein